MDMQRISGSSFTTPALLALSSRPVQNSRTPAQEIIMLKRILPAAALVAPLFAAACGERPAEPVKEAAAPAPEPAPPPAAAPAAPPELIEASYECVPVMALSAKYDNSVDPPRATVTLDSKTFDMTLAPSASGARYVAIIGRSPDTTLVWWNKGADGVLLEGKGATSENEQPIATCVGKSS
jgi:membrane-bound inhibitor of C-type lysozyme